MQQDRDWNGDVAEKKKPGEKAARRGQTGRQLFVIQAKRLEKTRVSVTQMEGEQKPSQDIERGDEDVLKAVDHHGINVVAVERIRLEQEEPGVGDADREVRKVIENKGENDQTAQRHGTRSESRFHVVFAFVTRRPRPAIFDGQTDRVEDVEKDVREEKDSNGPEDRAELAQMFRVTIHPVGSEKDLQIPEKMSDHERDQDDASHRHNHFFADR